MKNGLGSTQADHRLHGIVEEMLTVNLLLSYLGPANALFSLSYHGQCGLLLLLFLHSVSRVELTWGGGG